jgi:hypothetical protein
MTPEEKLQKQRDYQKAYREAHKDKAKAYQQKYREANGEHLREEMRQYHADHKEVRNAYRRKWSIDNKAKEKAGRDAWYAENKDGKYRDTILRTKYGITLTQYNELLVKQGGTCALCSRTDAGTKDKRRLHVDHCHQTGIVRGLLCHFHNTAVGAIGDDPTQFGERIQAYLAGNPSAS